MAGQAHQPAHGLHHHVVGGTFGIGAGPAEPAHRRVHQPRPAGVQDLPSVAHPVEGSGAEVLHQHVGPVEELLELLAVIRDPQVERRGRLAPVERLEVHAATPVEGPEPPRVVPPTGTLHLDHPRPEVGEHHGGVRTGQHPAQVDDRYVGEGPVHPR